MILSNITAVIVTRGGQSEADVLSASDRLKSFAHVIVWDNSRGARDARVFGRYLGALIASTDFVYVQDDDCVVDAERIAAGYQPGELLINFPVDRRPEYAGTGMSLIGWGAVFPREWVLTSFAHYLERYQLDELFQRECDRIFTYANRHRTRLIDVGVTHTDSAHGLDRMGREPRHRQDFLEIQERVRGVYP